MDYEQRIIVKDFLAVSIVELTFKKINGKIRKMKATLFDNYYPQSVYDDTCKVYDTTKRAWRSFKWNNLKSIKVVF